MGSLFSVNYLAQALEQEGSIVVVDSAGGGIGSAKIILFSSEAKPITIETNKSGDCNGQNSNKSEI